MEHIVIGICGPAGAGKSMVAEQICKRYFATQVSFAEPIRKMLHPMLDQLMYDRDASEVDATLHENKEEMIKELNVSARYLMQHLGGFFRDVNLNTFVTLANKKIEMLEGINQMLSELLGNNLHVGSYGYIIDDVRYNNEAHWITGVKRGAIIRVERPTELLKEVPKHHSERGINRDYVSREYTNSDKIEDAIRIADEIATLHKLKPIPTEMPREGKIVMPMENNNVH